MNYWVKRNLFTQIELSNKATKDIEEQLAKYYARVSKRLVRDFELTYEKLLKAVDAGKEPTPADLYKLDSYWKMLAEAQAELNKLGNYECDLFIKRFTDAYINIYQSLAIGTDDAFATIDREAAEQIINQVWCADGKSWSSRIWKNTDRLREVLNDKLIECVITGKKSTELKKILMEEFQASYRQANSIARTEIAHIQTQAARDRYIDAGIEQVEVWADKDERRCDICGKLHRKKFPVWGAMPVPAHPNCRCCVIPVIK